MKIESAFLCDDVRQEANGKLIFVGVYSQDMILPVFPVAINLNLVVCARLEQLGIMNVQVEALLDGELLMGGTLGVNVGVAGFGFLPIPLPIAVLPHPGKLTVRLKEKSGRWRDVSTLELRAKPAPVAPA